MSSWQELSDEEKQRAREFCDFESGIPTKVIRDDSGDIPKMLKIRETQSGMSDGKVTFPPPTSWKPKCENLKLFYIAQEHIPAWITSSLSISRKFKKLEIDCWSVAEPLGALIHNIEASETLRVLCESGMTDGELEKIEALDISITSDQISVEAVRKRMENFIKCGKRTDKLELRIQHPQFFDARKDLLSENWVVTKMKKNYEEEGEFDGKILSGFENVHGILDTRKFTAEYYGDSMGVYCSVFKKSETPLTTYPF